MQYHLTEAGPKPCSASKIACPLGGNHFKTRLEAEKAFAENLSQSGLESLSTNAEGKLSAEISRQYGHWSIINDHLHNASETGNEAELLYYSTAQGLLELARRGSGKYGQEYRDMAEKIMSREKPTLDYDLDNDFVEKLIKDGEAFLQRDAAQVYNGIEKLERHIPPLQHTLVHESNKWLRRITPEQQEAISWLTSNGFGIAQYALGIKSEYDHFILSNFVDENKIHDAYGDDWDAGDIEIERVKTVFAKKYLDTVYEAMKKAPKFDKPVVITRGSSMKELADILGESSFSNSKEMMDTIESGKVTNERISPNARMTKIPLSASANPAIALRFTKNLWKEVNEDRTLVLAIYAKTAACPVNVGAWGSAEYEVLTNPTSDYKILGGKRVGDDEFVLELEEIDT